MVLREALETDIALKTGGFKSTQEAPQEMLALLDRFVLRVTELFAHPALLSV